MNHQRFCLRVILVITGCSLGFAIIPLLSAETSGTAQEEDKVIEKRNDWNPPVRIKAIKSRLGNIETGKKIETHDDDWLKGLKVRVHNLSDKTVTHVVVQLWFVRPKEQAEEKDFVVPLEYGPSPLRPVQQDVPTEPPILPGESAEVSLSDSEYDSLRPILNDLNFKIKKVRVFIGVIGFSDGTAWMSGRIFKRDTSDPEKWVPVDKSPASRKGNARADPFLFIKDSYNALPGEGG